MWFWIYIQTKYLKFQNCELFPSLWLDPPFPTIYNGFFSSCLDLGYLSLCNATTTTPSSLFLSQSSFSWFLLVLTWKRATHAGYLPTLIQSSLLKASPFRTWPFIRVSLAHYNISLSLVLIIAYAVQQIFLYMHGPRELYFISLKCILTTSRNYYAWPFDSSISYLSFVSYWDGCLRTRRSVFGFCFYLGENLICAHLNVNMLFLGLAPNLSTEVDNVVAKVVWLQNLIELGCILSISIFFVCM